MTEMVSKETCPQCKGNRFIEIRYDCDADCLLVLVDQTGVACHTKERSCFYRTLFKNADIVSDTDQPAEELETP